MTAVMASSGMGREVAPFPWAGPTPVAALEAHSFKDGSLGVGVGAAVLAVP